MTLYDLTFTPYSGVHHETLEQLLTGKLSHKKKVWKEKVLMTASTFPNLVIYDLFKDKIDVALADIPKLFTHKLVRAIQLKNGNIEKTLSSKS
jgi:branched-subunit amino acid transport protein AzlD